jgi:hypothetical protein
MSQWEFLEQRGQITNDLGSKLGYLLTLIRSFVLDEYSPIVTALQVALLACGFTAMIDRSMRSSEPASAQLLRTAAYVGLVIMPFAPLLVPAESPLSARAYYLAPFMIVAAILSLDQWLRWAGEPEWPLIAATGVLIALFLPFSLSNSADFVAVYREDNRYLSDIANRVRREQGHDEVRLALANSTQYPRPWDPSGIADPTRASLTDRYSDGKASSYLAAWAFEPFVLRHAGVTADLSPESTDQCTQLCVLQSEPKPMSTAFLSDGATTCLCP